MADALAELGEAEVARLNAQWPPSHVAPNFGANRAIIATRSAQEWVEHFWQHDVSAQIAAQFGDIYFDEQARLNGYVVEINDATLGKTLQPGPAWKINPPARIGRSTSKPGEDNDTVFETPQGKPRAPAAAPQGKPLPPLHGVKVLDLDSTRGNPAYNASKTGAFGLTRTLGEAWARDGIRVNGIAPGLVETKLTRITTEHPKRLEGALRAIPLGRLGTPQDMANVALFLASPMASYMLGQTLLVDGGMLLA